MTVPEQQIADQVPLQKRVMRVAISIIVLTGVTVVFGYGGWVLLTIAAKIGVYSETTDEPTLRDRLAVWPDRNRDVMRTNGRVPLPLTP